MHYIFNSSYSKVNLFAVLPSPAQNVLADFMNSIKNDSGKKKVLRNTSGATVKVTITYANNRPAARGRTFTFLPGEAAKFSPGNIAKWKGNALAMQMFDA
jgi:hypothetical protein